MWPKTDACPQIIASPEVISVLPERPILAELTKNLYDCHYDKFFVALGKLLHICVFLSSWYCLHCTCVSY
jgi:hypothetical protein